MCVNEYPEYAATGRHLEPICLPVKQFPTQGRYGLLCRREQSLAQPLSGCCRDTFGTAPSSSRGTGSAFAQPHFQEGFLMCRGVGGRGHRAAETFTPLLPRRAAPPPPA